MSCATLDLDFEGIGLAFFHARQLSGINEEDGSFNLKGCLVLNKSGLVGRMMSIP
jgi:hypothetical protein